jgi:hypothetical protein
MPPHPMRSGRGGDRCRLGGADTRHSACKSNPNVPATPNLNEGSAQKRPGDAFFMTTTPGRRN